MPPDQQQLCAEILERARQLLPGDLPLRVILIRGQAALVCPESDEAGPLPAPPLSPVQRDILATLEPLPQSVPQLARRTGHHANTYFRNQLRLLVDAGLARRVSGGYCRPNG